MKKMFLEDCCEILDSQRVPITAANRAEGSYPYYGANGVQDYVDDYIFDDELVLLAEDGGNFGSKTKPIAYRVSGKCWVNNHAHVLKPKNGLDVDFLCYSLMFYNTDGLVNGATRQKLTQATMRKMLIPDLSKELQLEIVNQLNRIVAIKNLRLKEIQKLDNLVKARFVEVFRIWENKYTEEPLNEFLENITYGFTNPMPDTEEGPWKITAKDVVDGKINFNTARKTSQESYNKLTAKSKPQLGNVLLTKDGTLGRTAVVDRKNICVNQSVAVLRVNGRIAPDFLSVLLQMPKYQDCMMANAGGGTIKHIYITKIIKMLIIVPTMEEQKVFLDFVHQVDKSKVVA